MTVVKERRESRIPPCKIDNELLKSLTSIMEETGPILYRLNAETKVVETNKVNEINTIPQDTKSIELTAAEREEDMEDMVDMEDMGRYTLRHRSDANYCQIKFNLQNTYFSSYLGNVIMVEGTNPTWVTGIKQRIDDCLNRKRLGYYWLFKSSSLPLYIMSFVPSLFLIIGYYLEHVSKPYLKPSSPLHHGQARKSLDG
jgi:hypothetical protein